jgi:cytochrome c biogenesis protein CcmG, thiol:disulfide interchange protein DsbE
MSAAGVTAPSAARVPGRLQTVVVLAVTAVVIGAIAFFAGGADTEGLTRVELEGAVAGTAPVVGSVPPGFTGVTYDGQTVSLADYAGKPLWLTFGASWCPDCRVEAPDVEATYQQYKDQGLQVLGVFISEGADDVAGYAQRASLTFPIVVDSRTQVAAAYRTMGIPTHFFIGADGTIKEVRIGAMHRDDMDRAVAAVMN